MNSKKKRLLLLGKIILFLITLEFLREFPCILFWGWPTDGNSINSQNLNISQGLNIVGQVNRAQQAYHFEHSNFAPGLKELEIEISDHTILSIETSKNSSFSEIKTTTVDIYATSDFQAVAPLFYYIFYKNFLAEEQVKYTLSSAIFFIEQHKNLYETIICESDKPGWQELNKPYLRGDEPVCGKGTAKYQ